MTVGRRLGNLADFEQGQRLQLRGDELAQACDSNGHVFIFGAAEAQTHFTIRFATRGIIAVAKLARHVEEVTIQRVLK